MQLVSITREGIESCYQLGMVKPNEFRQLCMNIIQKELQLRTEEISLPDVIKLIFKKNNYFVSLYQELSDCQDGIAQCIINLASSSPEDLLVSEEEAKKLFLSYVFYRKALLVRDCSDMFKNNLTNADSILVDKETLRAIEYLSTHANGGKALLKDLYE